MKTPFPANDRRGAVLVAALVCLLVAAMLASTAIGAALMQRRQLRVEHDARQAELLVAAGRKLAKARLGADPAYRGHQWRPLVRDSPVELAALVTISAADSSDPPVERRRRFLVTATYPADTPRPIRRSQTFDFSVEPIED